MSLLPREELRALRWELLGMTPKNHKEESYLYMVLKRLNAELAVRNKNLMKNEPE
jgi:hypothetical protein